MTSFCRFAVVSLVAVGMTWAVLCQADDLDVGDKAPDWKAVVGVDDKEHSLAEYSDSKLLVLVFTCNHCPVAKKYENRLIALQTDYRDKKVQVVAINSNSAKISPNDSFEKMKVRASGKDREKHGDNTDPFNFPYLYDKTQQIGRDYMAKKTPHVFLLDSDRKVVYIGAIDSDQREKVDKKHHLREAIDALLKGEEPPVTVTRAVGCGVKYEKKKKKK